MTYLSFDIECANCYQHQGKICSFGYVISDEAFRIKEEKDLIINPDAPFDPHVLGEGDSGISLAYTPLRFHYAPKFDHFLPLIQSLLVGPSIQVIGFAIDNDVGFLNDECHRYHLSLPSFSYVDVQEIYRLYCNDDYSPSLENALLDMAIPVDDYAEHQSSDDAKMTLLLLKAILQETHQSLDELVASYPSCQGTTARFLLEESLSASNPNFMMSEEEERKRHSFRHLIGHSSISPLDKTLLGQHYFFASSAMNDIDLALSFASAILAHGGELAYRPREAKIIVVGEKEESLRVRQAGYEALTLAELKSFLQTLAKN